MFKVIFLTPSGAQRETIAVATTDFAARKAVAAREDCDVIVSCELAYAPCKTGGKTTKAVAAAAETLRNALKDAYGADFAFEVYGNSALIAASCFEHGTVLAEGESVTCVR